MHPAFPPSDHSHQFWKAVGIGVVTAALLSAVMVPAIKMGVSPMPKPVALAFAERLFNRELPLPLGLLFHVAWVTFWSVVYVVLFHERLSFARALGLAGGLFALALIVFFPFIGWGFAGLAISPKLIMGALISHALFAVFLWGLCRLVFDKHEGRVAAY